MGNENENLKGWKSDAKPLPEPIEIKDVDEKLLIIKNKSAKENKT